jgi:NAD(P)-dependent dehydrogenase (short-subunit alcohol dehydrogenase family)/uncharacterized OB-fold protein
MTMTDLPPRNRGRGGRRLTAAAAFGRFELAVCAVCGTVQYPVREICGECLSDDLSWRDVPDAGTLLALTTVHHSVDPFFARHTPVRIGSVQLDAGPIVLALLTAACGAPGIRVRILNRLDRSGEAVLVATASGDTEETMPIPDPNREIAGRVVLVTGADGDVGRALVAALRHAGAAEVIAARTDLARAAGQVEILINNVRVNRRTALIAASSSEGARAEMETNYFSLLDTVRAIAPAMQQRRQGVILNVLSVLGHVNDAAMGSYCASQAAALSLTQGIRAELAPFGVRVCGLFVGAIDTPANTDLPPPKLSPAALAAAAVKMIRDGIEDHYPGAAAELHAALREDAKVVEREMAARLSGR